MEHSRTLHHITRSKGCREGVANVWLISACPYGQFPATRYPASAASAALLNATRLCGATRRELYCVTRSPQRAMLAVLSATPTAGSVQNQPIRLALLLVPFVPTLQGPHSQEHIVDTT